MSGAIGQPDVRCAAHPGRPAADGCPQCHRPRCAADVAQYAAACCAVCLPELRAPRPAGRLELAARIGLAGLPVAVVGGWISTQYFLVHVFSWLVPGLLGLATSAAASLATRGHRVGWQAVTGAALAAVLGTALGFRLQPGGVQSVLHPFAVVGAPYLAAVLGAALWPVLFPAAKPPREG
jgi:hypothetical protein